MASYGWLTRFETDAEVAKDLASDAEETSEADETADLDEDEEKAEPVSFADAIIEKGKQEDASRDEIYDWLYVETLKGNYSETFDIAKRLAKDGGKPEQKFFLSSLAYRGVDKDNMQNGTEQNVADPDPLSEDEVELMLKCFKETTDEDAGFGSSIGSGQVLFSGGRIYVRVGNSYQQIGQGDASMAQVVKELKLAGKDEMAEKMISDKIAAAKSSTQLVQAMLMLISEKKADQVEEFFSKWKTAAEKEIELAPIKVSRGGKSKKNYSANQTAQILGLILKWTGPLAKEEENAKVLSIVNQVLDVEMKELVKKRLQAKASRKRRRRRSQQNQYYDNDIPYQYGDEQSTGSVDYPRPGDYLSTTGIRMLYQASQVLKKNEVEDDLMSLLRERVKKAKSDSADSLAYEQMLLATLLYWGDEKDESIETFRAVASGLKDDPAFQFEIASLNEKLGDLDESLNIVETIEPSGQKLVEQKETTALRLAERLGDIDRARTAAERLFGLRLKAQTQLSLVSNMKRLGLSEMADAVISRAQRRSGQKIPAMVSLMGLYQGQGKTDLANQVAHRILQRTRSTVSQKATTYQSRGYSSGNSNESHRRAAISSLQQTGALTALIERLEKQQKRSPNSPVIYEQLIELYMQTNNSDKLIPLLETAVESRPKSTYFREQLAKQYSSKGKNDEACEQYAAAIRENPSMLSDDYYEIKQFFQTADKMDVLLDIFQSMNIREFGQPYYVANFASELLQQSQRATTEGMTDEEKKAQEATETAAIRLAEKIFDEYPSYRRYVIQNFRNAEVWKNKRLFGLARRSIIPTRRQAKADPWYGLNDISSYSSDGSVNSMFHDIFESIEGADQEEELCESIRKNIEKKPEWLAGKVMLAMFDVRDDKEDEARKSLSEIFADEKVMDSVSGESAWLVAQELEKFTETRDVAIKLLEKASEKADNNNNQIQHSATGKLAMLYLDMDQKDKARELLLEAVKKDTHQNYDRQYQMYQKGQSTTWVATKLMEIECPADAVAIMQKLVNDDELLRAWEQYGGNNRSFANQLYSKALVSALEKGDSADLAEKIIAVRDKPRSGEGAFDLQVGLVGAQRNRQPLYYHSVNGQTVPYYGEEPEDKGAIECKLFDLMDTIAKKEEGKKLLADRLKNLQSEKPDDLSIAIASTWFEQKRDPDSFDDSVKSLLKMVEEKPLDEIREGRRPNSRQRREALQHVALWPITARCLKSKDEDLRKLGAKLGEYAIEGAERQTEKAYQHKMLFDWGTWAIKKKDAKQAEAKWTELLEEVTKRPIRKKKKAIPGAVPAGRPSAVPRLRPTPSRRGTGSYNPGFDRFKTFAALTAIRSSVAILQVPAVPKQVQEKTETKSKTAFIPPLTNSQFQTTRQIALAAADNDMVELSKRAMRELLKGGLPVADPNFENQNNNSRQVFYSSPSFSGQSSSGSATSASQFGVQVISVLDAWKLKKDAYDPGEVYDMVVGELFPNNRPDEILLYEQSNGINNASVSSLARVVVGWAAKADRMDDLNERIEQRASKPQAEVQAMVLKGMIALEKEDHEATAANLKSLLERVTAKPVPRDVLLACHIAVPAYDADKSLRELCIDVYRKNMEANKNPNLGTIASRVNRHLAANGGEAEVRQFFEDYLIAQQAQYSNYGGDYGVYQMQNALFRAAADVSKANLTDLAMEYIGRGKDIKMSTNYGSNDVSGWADIAKRIRSKPADQRYETLKEWTLPKTDRQSVRFVSAWDEPDGEELNDFYIPEVRDLPESSLPGLHCNFLDLIDAASEAGKMDDLASSIKDLDTKKYPDIEALKVCIAIKTKDPAAKEMAKKYADSHLERARVKRDRSDRTNGYWCEHLVYRMLMQNLPAEAFDIYESHRKRIFEVRELDGDAIDAARRDYEVMRATMLDAKIEPGSIAPLVHWSTRKPRETAPQPWTVCDNNQLIQLSGSRVETFWLNYPLKGDFKFSCEALSTGSPGVSFGGVRVDAMRRQSGGNFGVSAIGNRDAISRRSRTRIPSGKYGRLTVEVAQGMFKYSFDDHLLYEEKLVDTYPWLFLHSKTDGFAVWRNPVFESQPEIAQEVQLVIGDRMEGWVCSGETQVDFRIDAEPKPKPKKKEDEDEEDETEEPEPKKYDWHATDGVLFGRANEDANPESDSYIQYYRPMADGEQFTYEFLYEPEKKMANPLIGPVVIGLVDGEKAQELMRGDSELADYPTYANILDSPHAIEPVKLKSGDWNQVSLKIAGENAEVTVNGDLVWRRPLAKLTYLYPGIQKFKTQSAEVRKLVIKGDWPSELPEGLADNAFESERQLVDADRNLVAEVVGDGFKNSEIVAFYDDENPDSKASDDVRYGKFRDWVLPDFGHGIRLDSRPVSKDTLRTESELAANEEPQLNCPAWDMITLAKETGKLDELTEAVNKIDMPEKKTAEKYREVYALKSLLAIANEDDESARANMKEIYASVVELEKEAKENKTNAQYSRYPFYLTAWFAAERPALAGSTRSFQKKCSSSYSQKILGRIERFAETNEAAQARPLTQWTAIPGSLYRSSSLDQWRLAGDGLLDRLPGEASTPLYFQSPLKGKFEITADVSNRSGNQCWLDYGGYAILPGEKNHSQRIASGGNGNLKAKKKVPRLESVVNYRIAVDGKVVETYVNDVRVSRHEFKEAPEPWFTLATKNSTSRPILRNVRITGKPEIPTEIDLLASDGLAWSGSVSRYSKPGNGNDDNPFSQRHYRQQGTPVDAWILKDGELTAGSLTEDSLETSPPMFDMKSVSYLRPMMEDGEFEFEMFADAKKKKLCHVSIGRTALLFKEDGVWRKEMVMPKKANEFVPDEKIEGSKGVELKDGDWNRVLLRLTGDKATLLVNDKELTTIDVVDAKVMRYPGLFRYSDQSNAQVRNVKLRGSWPTSLPAVEQQELASQSDDPFAGAIAGEAKTFDLTQSIDDLKVAGLKIKGEPQLTTSDQGLQAKYRSNEEDKKWPTLTLASSTSKDFDVSLDFADLKIVGTKEWGCNLDLRVKFNDAEKSAITIGIRRDKKKSIYVLAQREYDLPHGKRSYEKSRLFDPFEKGQFRLVRRSGMVYCIAAGEGKPQQVIASFTVGKRSTTEFSAVTKSASDTTEMDVVLKGMSVKLDQ